MADEKEETGGIVTTVKTQDTSDLDVKAILEAQAAENTEAAEGEGAVKTDGSSAEVKEDKPGKSKAPTGEPKNEENDDLDDEGPIDFKSLNTREQKLVAKAFQQQRNRSKKEARELRERVEALSAEISGIKKGSTEPEREKPAATVGKPVRPRRRDFAEGNAGDDAYDAAVEKHQDDDYKWRRQQEADAMQAEEQKAADRKVIAKFNEAADSFMETHPDYEDVVDSDVPLTPVMFGYMLEFGPQLGYFWGHNPEEAEKIAKLSEKQQDKACMRLVVKLEEEEAQAKAKADKTKSDGTQSTKEKKPEPPKPVAARGSQTVAKDSSKMTFREREQAYAKAHPGALNYEP